MYAKNKLISVRLRPDVYKDFSKVCRKRKMTVSGRIRLLIEQDTGWWGEFYGIKRKKENIDK